MRGGASALPLVFITFTNMPTYKHTSGAVTAAKRVTATDVFTQDADGAIIEVDQPAGTILSEVIVRFTNTSTHAASSSAGWEIGTESSGTQLGDNPNGFLDTGTSIPENCVFFLKGGTANGEELTNDSANDAASPSAAPGYTATDRTLYMTFLHGNTEITTNSDVEVNFVFTHLI